MDEIWKPISGFENKYEVSNLGRVRTLTFYHPRLGLMDRIQIIKHHLSKMGKYPIVGLWLNSKITTRKVHRLVAAAFIDNPDNKPFVNHKDGDKTNNVVDNLEWCTSQENNKHGYDTGLIPNCENHPMSKLSNQQAKDIYDSNLTYSKLAAKYNISIGSIAQIKQGKTYKSVTNAT